MKLHSDEVFSFQVSLTKFHLLILTHAACFLAGASIVHFFGK